MIKNVILHLRVVLMMMTLMVLWLEPRSTERMIISNLNFILHLFCLLDLQWKLPFNGTHPPRLSKSLIILFLK